MRRIINVFLILITVLLIAGCGEQKYPYEGKVGTGIITLYKTNPVDSTGRVVENWKEGESCQMPAGTEFTALYRTEGRKYLPSNWYITKEFEYLTSEKCSGNRQVP